MTVPAYNFSGRDFTAEYERLLALLRVELPTYTDFNHSDVGIILLRLVSRETDQLNYYIDRVFQEGFISTAVFKQSLIELGKLVGYTPTLASPAATTMRLSRIEGVTSRVVIPEHTIFSKADGIEYITIEPVAIEKNHTYVDVTAIQGKVHNVTITLADLVTNDWTPNLRYNLGTNVVSSTVTVEHTDEPIIWDFVESFWVSDAEDFHFTLDLNGEEDTVWLVFGNGEKGILPPSGDIRVEYVTTSGSTGNCGEGLVVTTSIREITCSNITSATGGALSEGTEDIRASIPEVTRAQRRGVNKADYEALVRHIPGVLHCAAVDRNDSLDWPHLHIVLYVVPEGGGLISDYLRELILASVTSWGTLGVWENRYILKEPTLVPVDITLRVGISQGYSSNVVTTAVVTALEDLLSPDNREIGGTLTFSELHLTVSAVPGVSWLDYDDPIIDTEVEYYEMITAGTITVTAEE